MTEVGDVIYYEQGNGRQSYGVVSEKHANLMGTEMCVVLNIDLQTYVTVPPHQIVKNLTPKKEIPRPLCNAEKFILAIED